jgi:hypothetical protein
MGNTIKYRVEKIRELWSIPSMPDVKEITFDTLPGLPTYMEVDAHTKDGLMAAMTALGLTKGDRIPDKNEQGIKIDGYRYFYNIPTLAEGRKIVPGTNLVFDTRAKEQFAEYLSESGSKQFDDLLAEQIQIAESLRL